MLGFTDHQNIIDNYPGNLPLIEQDWYSHIAIFKTIRKNSTRG
jgi:hypothetical protein